MSDSIFTIPIEFASHDGISTINAKLWTSAAFGDCADIQDGLGAKGGETPSFGVLHDGQIKPKAIVQLIHGMSEYIDRYDEFARYLVGRGFVVCADDHIGHGGSASDPSEFGHMPVDGGKAILLADVHTLRSIVSGLYPGVPYCLYGHSMGSFIGRSYISRYGEGLSACVLSGTGSVPVFMSKMGRVIANTLARLRGETYRSKFIDSLGSGSYGKKIENARTSFDWLSNDETVVDAYIADERCGFMFTVGGYSTLLDLTAEIATPECAAGVPKDLPVLFVAGDNDPVGDMGKGVVAAANLLRDAEVSCVDLKLYEGMRHEIHNEAGKDQVYDDIASWLEKHIP